MNAKEGSARPAALGRGLDTLMGNEEERDAPSAGGNAGWGRRGRIDPRRRTPGDAKTPSMPTGRAQGSSAGS